MGIIWGLCLPISEPRSNHVSHAISRHDNALTASGQDYMGHWTGLEGRFLCMLTLGIGLAVVLALARALTLVLALVLILALALAPVLAVTNKASFWDVQGEDHMTTYGYNTWSDAHI